MGFNNKIEWNWANDMSNLNINDYETTFVEAAFIMDIIIRNINSCR